MTLAILLLATGLIISAVAIYYSVIGLAAIFAAATIPIYIMGGSLEVAKLVCASWLKANWHRAPRFMKTYMTIAVLVLMFITSMGIFGFLSKAHTDQNIVSGDVQSKIAVYDERIATEKENIDAARKALKQMDEAVDQTMARSTTEQGAGRAAQLRRQQQAERTRLQKDIATAQSNISRLQSERAPIAAEVRKVEAEVGPIKYIAKLIYGDNPDANLLEKAVTWVIILIVIVFDPLAVVMLLAAQMTFQWIREEKNRTWLDDQEDELNEAFKPDPWVADVGEKPTAEELADDPEVKEFFDNAKAVAKELDAEQPKPHHPDTHPYLRTGFKYPEDWQHEPPMVAKPEEVKEEPVDDAVQQALAWAEEQKVQADIPVDFPAKEESSKKKNKYIIKEQNHQVTKNKE